MVKYYIVLKTEYTFYDMRSSSSVKSVLFFFHQFKQLTETHILRFSFINGFLYKPKLEKKIISQTNY